MHRFLTHPSNIVCLSRPVPDNLAIAAQMHGAEAWHDARGQRGRFMPPEVGIAEALARRNWPLVERYGSITVRLGTKGLVPVHG